ncbi:tachylectin-related carbohydrate-binding protein [Actinoplanes missouriensis]|uniref:tachylectin-related carbohydrate-binding protein n=1 Tax=Actinoplanes missouriensis TaxID=1866 RepID=UPI0034052095
MIVPAGLAAASPAQAADTFQCSGNATVFGVNAGGQLYRYTYTAPGTDAAAGSAGVLIGTGWNGFTRVLGGPNGRLYGINANGAYRYRWTGSDWETIAGSQSLAMGTNLAEYANAAYRNKITVDEIGDFYGVDSGGKLRQWRYDEGTKAWTVNGKVLDTGWDRYNLIVAAGPGVLYGRTPAGLLYRHRYETTSQRWVVRDQLVGESWGMFPQDVFSVGGDTLFGRQTNGDLYHYRFREDNATWPLGGKRVGAGWNMFNQVVASTDTCRLTERHIPVAPANPVQRFAPMAVQQGPANGASVGPIEYVYTDNIGRLRHAYQSNPDIFTNAQWSTVSSDEAFSGEPALLQNGQQALQTLAHKINSDVWSFTRAAAPSTGWQAGLSLAGRMASRPAAVRLSDNSLAVFAVDAGGSLWSRFQDGTGGDLLPWRRLGGENLEPDVTVVAGADRSATLFARQAGGGLRTATYANGTLSSWFVLGAGPDTSANPAVVVLPGRKLRVFATDANGEIVSQQQDASGAFPGYWSPVGFTAKGAPAAVLDPALGRMAVVARGVDNEIYRVFETGPGDGTWGAWQRINPDVSDPAQTDPVVAEFTGSTGQSWMIVFRNQNDVTRVYTRQEPSALARTSTAAPGLVGHSLPKPRP